MSEIYVFHPKGSVPTGVDMTEVIGCYLSGKHQTIVLKFKNHKDGLLVHFATEGEAADAQEDFITRWRFVKADRPR